MNKARIIKLENRLATVGRPPGCSGRGEYCTKHELLRVGSGDPPPPEPPATCPRCGRATFTRTIIVVEDDGPPPPIPEVGPTMAGVTA